ncbi:hypothetical protein FQN57_002144 [Myotisia sp. PD_48]|nr:hypothetical protein FQN57_002144 [Myotisia sp. PD_48]
MSNITPKQASNPDDALESGQEEQEERQEPVTRKRIVKHRQYVTTLSNRELTELDPLWLNAIQTINILSERLQAWKHVCESVEKYVEATGKAQKAHSKEYEKVLKSISEPLKDQKHFAEGQGGIGGLFDNLRDVTQRLSDIHSETDDKLKHRVLPIFKQLHSDIKAKMKEISSGPAKAGKLVSHARKDTKKHVQLLGKYTATFDADKATRSKPKLDAAYDPYILARGIYHRMCLQIEKENANFRSILDQQNAFPDFEKHILNSLQRALEQLFQCIRQSNTDQQVIYTTVLQAVQQIPPDFEWANFGARHHDTLLDPNTPPHSLDKIDFPNKDHRATKPVIEGILERKSRAIIKGYSAGYYVITPAGYLHGFKDGDSSRYDPPSPDISYYIPECSIGKFKDLKFVIRGKDVSGGKVENAFHISQELNFKVSTASELETWQAALESLSNPNSSKSSSSPTGGSITVDTGSNDGTGSPSRKVSGVSHLVASPESSSPPPPLGEKASDVRSEPEDQASPTIDGVAGARKEKPGPQEDGVVSV